MEIRPRELAIFWLVKDEKIIIIEVDDISHTQIT
jgi:hypothetical protein